MSNKFSDSVQEFLDAKDLKTFEVVKQLVKDAFDSSEKEGTRLIAQSHLYDLIPTSLKGLETDIQKEYLAFFISFGDNEEIMKKFSPQALLSLFEISKSSSIEISEMSLRILSQSLKMKKAIEPELLTCMENNLPAFFNRRVHKDVVVSAATLLASIIEIIPLNKMNFTEIPMAYLLQHICEEILSAAFEAAVNLTSKGCDAISYFIEHKYDKMMYSQIRYPSVKMKAMIFKAFTNVAACCKFHRAYVKQHDMKDRLPAFICHYDDSTCLQCIEMLDAMEFSVQEMLDNKFIISLVLHATMSNDTFKFRCFDIIYDMFKKANEKQVNSMIECGFIRPFCTLLASATEDKAKDILTMLLSVVEDYQGLESKLCRFDFDHAHSFDNKSCVDQINALKSRHDAVITRYVERLLEHLAAKGIVMHEAGEQNSDNE